MLEVALAGENHGDASGVGGRDGLAVLHGAARLDDRPNARATRDLDAVRVGEKTVARQHGALRSRAGTVHGKLNRLDPVNRDAVETASAAANDAVTVLRGLSQGATPRVSYATEPIDLNELMHRALGMARPRARAKEIELGARESAEDVKVRADPLLLREVITNLINNAIDAAPPKGRVDVITGRRGNGWPFVTVADNGPGVADEHRHHLFEPHFTTKESGTGIGLFMSYGVVREHEGSLSYEGSRRGAVDHDAVVLEWEYARSSDFGR